MGPGTTVRGPLSVRVPSTGVGGQYTETVIADANGNILQDFFITFVIPAGATAADYDGVIPVPVAAKLISVTERHQTAGTDGSAVTLMVKKVPSGTAKASGTDCLAAGTSLKSTADTNVSPALHATAANSTFAAGDGVALVTTGTLTAVDGVGVTCRFRRL